MKRALLFALSLVPAFCLAEKQTELSEESKKQLADLVSANDYLAVVEINQGTLTNIGKFCRVHDKVKVVAHLKGRLRATFSFLFGQRRHKRPRVTARGASNRCRFLPPEPTWSSSKRGRSLIQRSVNQSHPSIISFSTMNGPIALGPWTRWKRITFGNLPKTISRQTNRKHPPLYLGSMNSKMKLLVEKGKSSWSR